MPLQAPELTAEEIASRLRDGLGDGLVEIVTTHGQVSARVSPDAWVEAARFVKTDGALQCVFFSWLSAIHWIDESATPAEPPTEAGADAVPATPAEPVFRPYPPSHEAGTYAQPQGNLLQVLALASSPMRRVSVLLKTELPEDAARIATLSDVYAGANWHERECHEMFGIEFDGHPDLSNLYLPEEFEGHPLLKSFPLGAREVKPWPGHIDVEGIPPEIEARLDAALGAGAPSDEADDETADTADSDAAGEATGESPQGSDE